MNLQRYLAYNLWANEEVCRSVARIAGADLLEVMKVLNHVAGAQDIWQWRLSGRSIPAEPFPAWQQATEAWAHLQSSHQWWCHWLSEKENPERFYPYTDLNGHPYQTQGKDILMHMVNHGTYHRGQIAGMIRRLGFEPHATDYILFARLFPSGA